MKRLFYFLIVLSCTLWKCGKSDSDVDNPINPDNPDNPTNVTLDISTTDLTFEASGGQKEFTIYCNSDWTITNNNNWCKTDMVKGNGDKTITVTTDPYSETEDQNTNLTIKAGEKTKVLTVTQKHGDAIILTKDKFDVPQEGENITIEVKSNIEYQVSIPSKFQTWIKQAVRSKALETKNFSFTISSNEDFDKREGYIVFSSKSLKDTVYVYQAQKNQLILTEDTYNIPSEGEDIIVKLKTNIDYEVSIPDSVNNWISLIQTKAIRTDKLNFSIVKNEQTNNRKAIVIIKDKNSLLTDTLYINQSQKNALILTQKIYNIKAEGETISVELKNNIQYDVIVPDSVSKWIKNIQTRALKTDKLQFSILANNTYSNRYAIVIFKDNNSRVSDTLKINQSQESYLRLSQKLYNISGQEEDINVELKTNVDYSVNIPDDANTWISLITTRALRTDLLKFHIKANLENKKRTTKIIVKDKNSKLADTIILNQTIQGIFIGDVILTTEDELEAFKNTGYKKIEGNLKIISTDFLTLKTLDNLLEEVTGNIEIKCPNLQSLKGLESIRMIGNSLLIQDDSQITNFEGLNNLQKIGQDFVLSSFVYGRSLSCFNKLISFEGLENLQNIGGSFILHSEIWDNPQGGQYKILSFNELVSFKGLENLYTIEGNFEIRSKGPTEKGGNIKSFYELLSLKGLSNLQRIGGHFFTQNTSLSSFEGLDNLTTIGGDLNTSSTSDFVGLNKLTEIGGSIVGVKAQFQGLEHVQYIGKNISGNTFKGLGSLQRIDGNISGTVFSGLEKLESIGGNLSIKNADCSFEGLENLRIIEGDLLISKLANSKGTCSNLKGLNNLKTVKGNFTFSLNSPIKTFEGLESLEEIGGNFTVTAEAYGVGLYALTSFKGLSKLSSIGGDFILSAIGKTQYSISPLDVLESFEGLESLQSIGGNFKIIAHGSNNRERYRDALKSFKSFKGLNNLQSIGGDFEITASVGGFEATALNSLKSFEGLESLQNIRGSFRINAKGEYYSEYGGGDSGDVLENLINFVGLDALESIGKDLEIISDGYSLSLFSSLQGFKLKSFGGDLHLEFGDKSSFHTLSGLEYLSVIGGDLILKCSKLSNITSLSNVTSVSNITITNCSNLYDFCPLRNAMNNFSGTYNVTGNGYNPRKVQIREGECSK